MDWPAQWLRDRLSSLHNRNPILSFLAAYTRTVLAAQFHMRWILHFYFLWVCLGQQVQDSAEQCFPWWHGERSCCHSSYTSYPLERLVTLLRKKEVRRGGFGIWNQTDGGWSPSPFKSSDELIWNNRENYEKSSYSLYKNWKMDFSVKLQNLLVSVFV